MDTNILKKDLVTLEIEGKELNEVTIKDIIKALKVHPPKQENNLLQLFRSLTMHMKES